MLSVMTASLVTALLSRFFVNVAFNIGLQYAAELLPTVIRAQGVNVIHIMGYVASIFSPFIASIVCPALAQPDPMSHMTDSQDLFSRDEQILPCRYPFLGF